ncbi:GPCR-chaperone protein (macronuclear) [Tetrahymena thermophila SB210]|uniref:GPCR-chaperone protein n=1 Tax=Tetrahymena thermophila (strain SB210) TaxID=312017 RepID=I7LXY2_TETTS|nr:GPCR-chaperone protein [Tetrahymena thermophila SB210]EAS06757.3 GPCR-chaperone protein [Tetrahymena thermophila SB210]|eukprot:XP_001026999.3 GPCR-chaperone protein [Tetrahymena thermophila SB210]
MQKKNEDFHDDFTQIDEDENESSKNVFSNMKKLGNSQYFSNPSRLQKQKIPDFEPRSNDLNAIVSNQSLNSQAYKSIGSIQYPNSQSTTNEYDKKISFQQPSYRNGSQPQIYQQLGGMQNQNQSLNLIEMGSDSKHQAYHHIKNSNHIHIKGYEEENINDNDYSSSEFDVSENEAVGPSYNINQSILNQYKNTFFNQKIKEFNERKARCHTLLPKQAQKYFRDQKTTKSYIEHTPKNINDGSIQVQSIKASNSVKRLQDSSFDDLQKQNFSVKGVRNKSAFQQRTNSDENLNQNNYEYNNNQILIKQGVSNDIKIQQQQQLQNQIAQVLPQSVLDANKFNLSFSSQQNNLLQQKKQNIQSQDNVKDTSSKINGNGSKFQQHNIPNTQTKISPNELSKILQNNSNQQPNQKQVNSSSIQTTSASQFSITQANQAQKSSNSSNRPTSFSYGINKQIKEESIQKQVIKSQQVQAKLEEQSKNIEEKKAAFQEQLQKKFNNAQAQNNNENKNLQKNNFQETNNIQNQTYLNNKQNQLTQNQNNKQIVSNQQIQSQNQFVGNDTNSKFSSIISPNIKQEQFQDIDTLNVNQIQYNVPNNLANSISDLGLDAQSRSSISQKYGLEKQSSFKMQQLQNNFSNQQYLQANDAYQRKSKKSLQNDHDLLAFPENETFVGTINTIDVKVDTQTVKTAQVVDKKEQNRLIDSEIYDSLVRAIFQSNIQLVETIVKRIINEERYHLINKVDEKGNTPLLLAVKLSYSNPNYYSIIKILLKHDADPRIRDRQDWSCFEEVVSQKDHQLASLLFENLINFKKKALLQQKREIDNLLLSDVPDFYMEMKWEFESNIIPFVSKLAPSDTFKIWKYGRSVRCDSTFAGFQKYRSKRRAQSLLFNCLNLNQKQVNIQTDFDFLTIVQKEEKTFHFPLQEVDLEEKKKIVQDLLNSTDSIQGNLKIEKTTINQSKSFFGSKQSHKIQGYTCDKYDLQLRYRYMIFKKTRIPFLKNYEKYISSNCDLSPTKSVVSPNEASYLSDRRNESMYNQQQLSYQVSMKDIKINGMDNGNPFEVKITETNKNEIKKQTLGLYVSEDFPIKFKVFMPLLQFLSNGNQLLMNLYEVFKDQQVNDVLIKKGFPVKVQIPLSYSIYANITFSAFKPLSCYENENVTQLFNIPNDSVFANRKQKQNTMIKQKKRLMLANLYLS